MAKKITAISVYTKDGGWSTPYPIGSTVKEASATIAGILKAYTSTGSNTDGTMTQAAITQAIDNAKTTINTASPTVAGVTKVYTSTGSNTDGTMTQAAVTQAIDNAKTTINTASPTVAGVTKVYTSTGSNTDGTMTQAAITQALSSIDALETKTDDMKASFQAGVDGIYNAITAQGTTPASKSQSDVQAAIPTLANNSYNKGSADGYNKGSADGYNKGLANGRNDSPIHVQYIRSWAAGASAGEINIRIIVTKNGRQVYDTGNFRPYNTDSKEFDC